MTCRRTRRPDAGRRSAAKPWRGSGGRWIVWVLRVVAWAVLLVIGYRGVSRSSMARGPRRQERLGRASHAYEFPQLTGGGLRARLRQRLPELQPGYGGRRSAELAAYLPASATASSSELGWNGAGTEHLQAEQVASIRRPERAFRGRERARRGQRQADRARRAGLRLRRRLVVSGQPAILAPPARAVLPTAPQVNSDQTTVSALTSQLPPFFRAYASGDGITLGRFLAPAPRCRAWRRGQLQVHPERHRRRSAAPPGTSRSS